MGDGIVRAVHGPHRHPVGKEFSPETVFVRMLQKCLRIMALKSIIGPGVSIDYDIVRDKAAAESGQIGKPVLVDNQTVEGVAYTDSACLRIRDYGLTLDYIPVLVEIGMADTGTCLYDRYFRILSDIVDKPSASPRDNEIHIARGIEKLRGRFPARRHHRNGVHVSAAFFETGSDEQDYRIIRTGGIRPAFQNACITRLKAQGKDIESHIGPRFIYDADYSERDTDFSDFHPVRPDSFATIENFYTTTIYDKGAELIRMLEKIIGYEGFHKGCDLYFNRHDGQAVTIDDLIKCMEDANNINLTQFMLWYSTPGRPTVLVEQKYDSEKKIFSLSLTQQTKRTTKPFIIPLDIGLIGDNGKNLISQTLILTQNKQTFTFPHIQQKPVLSINRSFTAPVTIKVNYTDHERSLLMTYDTDDFNRYEIGQNYALKEILSMVHEKRETPDESFIKAFGSYLNQANIDPAFVARAIILPESSLIGEQMDIFDVDSVLNTRRIVRNAFACKFSYRLNEIYTNLAHFDKPFSPDPKEAGKRALKNTALNSLAAIKETTLVKEAYLKANNMTDLMAALSALVTHELPGFEEALQDFYNRYKEDHLVLNKWFSLQAMADLKDSLNRVQNLMSHPKFQRTNPNNIRAVIGGFSHNLRAFHALDGSGYQFLADQVISLNALNPQMAEKILHPLTRIQHFNETRQILMTEQLERILKTNNLSINVQETISRALNGD